MSIYPTVRPSLTLDFQKGKQLDPRISFSRSSTATYVEGGVVKYADEHQARFEDEGLLIEEARTNLLPESGNLNDQAYWHTSTNPGGINQAVNYGWMVATSNTTEIASPDGTNNAVKLSGLTTSTNDKNYQVYTIPVNATIPLLMNTVYSYTVWINDPDSLFNGVDNVFELMHGSNFSNTTPTATFDLANNTVTFAGDISSEPSGKVEDYPNGWKKLTASFANTASDGFPKYRLRELSPNTGTVTQFSANGERFYAFGFQIEEGSFPSSYIPTAGATATRAADLCSITGDNFSSWYNQGAGTVLSIADRNGGNLSSLVWHFRDGGRKEHNANGGNFQFYDVGYTSGNKYGDNYTPNKQFKGIYAFETNNAVSAIEGVVAIDSESTTYTPTVHSNLSFGSNNTVNTFLNGHIARFVCYPERLPNEQLEALTS